MGAPASLHSEVPGPQAPGLVVMHAVAVATHATPASGLGDASGTEASTGGMLPESLPASVRVPSASVLSSASPPLSPDPSPSVSAGASALESAVASSSGRPDPAHLPPMQVSPALQAVWLQQGSPEPPQAELACGPPSTLSDGPVPLTPRPPQLGVKAVTTTKAANPVSACFIGKLPPL